MNDNDQFRRSFIMILDRSTLLPLLIFDIDSTSVMYPILVDSASFVAKFILVFDTDSIVMVIDNNLEITSCLDYWFSIPLILSLKIE